MTRIKNDVYNVLFLPYTTLIRRVYAIKNVSLFIFDIIKRSCLIIEIY